MDEFLEELKRRNVFRIALAYLTASWLLIQLVETLFPIFELSDALIRLVVIMLAIGFPLVLIFSWVYELTPEGLKLDRDVDRSAHPVRHTGKKLDRTIIVMLTLALGYFAFDKFVLDPERDAVREATVVEQVRSETFAESFGDRSIAVLPFVNMSDDQSNEYFSDGISEELLNLLSKIPNLRVISRSSSFSFKGKETDIPTIAKQLNVAHVLEGSVRKAGNQVRITAQLIEARSDTHLWSGTYDRELIDIFGIQDEISAAIVGALRENLALEVDSAPQATAVTNIEAHEAYLRGRYLAAQRTATSLEGAISEFGKAIELDPDFALAHAELANTYLLTYTYGDQTEVDARAALHVERAMTLDPTLAETRAAAGHLAWTQGHREDALSHFEDAVQINPNYAAVYVWMGNILGYELGRYEESFAAHEIALRLNPLSIPAISNYVWELIYRNRLAEADRELEKLVSIAPGTHAWIRATRMSLGGNWANLALGNLDSLKADPASLRQFELATDFALIGLEADALAIWEPTRPSTVSMLGKKSDAVSAAEALLAEDPESLGARLDLGLSLAGAGNYARAGPLLEDVWSQRDEHVVISFDADIVAALVAIRRRAGVIDDLDGLLAPLRENARHMREAGITVVTWSQSADYDLGLAHYLAGDRDKGLELISRAAKDGFFIFPNEAYLQELYDDPGFAPILENQKLRQTKERRRFLGFVCKSNPYSSVWQPEEGTCERFATEVRN